MLADLDQRRTAPRLLGLEPRPAANSIGLGNLELRVLIPRGELEAFVERIVPIRMISRRMLRSHTFGYVTAALPGLEAFLMMERLRQLADEAAARNGFVVIDAPASGGVLELLTVSKGVRDLAPSGTLNRLVRGIDEFVRNPQLFGVWLTARPERLGVTEALETLATLRAQPGVRYFVGILNGVPDPLLSAADYTKIARVAGHQRLALERKATCEMAAWARRRFEKAGLEVVQLPMLYTSEFARPQIEILAGSLDRVATRDIKEE